MVDTLATKSSYYHPLHQIDSAHFIDVYMKHGGYSTLSDDKSIERVSASRFLNRNGISLNSYWSRMALPPTKPRSILANLASYEPGLFATRRLIQRNPHGLIEGMLIAARATGSDQGFIVSPLEDHILAQSIDRALAEAEKENQWGNTSEWSFNLKHIRLPKSILYDQDSFLLASLSGARPGYPNRKEFLCASPVHIHRAEEFYALVAMASSAGEEFLRSGSLQTPGVYLLTVSGEVPTSTTIEVPGGTPLSEIMQIAGVKASVSSGWLRWGGVLGSWQRWSEIKDKRLELAANGSLRLKTFQYPLLEWFGDESAAAAKRAMSYFVGDQSCGACLGCSRSTTGLSKWTRFEKTSFLALSKCSLFARACEASEGPAW